MLRTDPRQALVARYGPLTIESVCHAGCRHGRGPGTHLRHGCALHVPRRSSGTVGVGIVAQDRTIVALAFGYDDDALYGIEDVSDADRLHRVDLAALDDDRPSSSASPHAG